MIKLSPLLAVPLFVLAACGTSHTSNATATPSTTGLFTDPSTGVSFQHPADWTPHPGSVEKQTTPQSYVIRISVPNNAAGPEVTITGARAPLPNFPNGKVTVDPSLGPGKYVYFHVNLARHKGMQVKHILSSGLSEIHTFVEVGHSLYDVRIVAAYPPMSANLLAGYNTIVSTLKVPRE